MCVREGHFCRRRTFQRFISLIMVLLTDCNATFTSNTPWAGRPGRNGGSEAPLPVVEYLKPLQQAAGRLDEAGPAALFGSVRLGEVSLAELLR